MYKSETWDISFHFVITITSKASGEISNNFQQALGTPDQVIICHQN